MATTLSTVTDSITGNSVVYALVGAEEGSTLNCVVTSYYPYFFPDVGYAMELD